MSDPLYMEIIIDEGTHPRNQGTIENPDISSQDSNTMCGDDITIELKVGNNKINEVKWRENDDCCTICKACTSVLTQMINGKDLDYVKNFDKDTILSELNLEHLGTSSPIRIKCALLSLKVLKKGLYTYLTEKLNTQDDADKLKEDAANLY